MAQQFKLPDGRNIDYYISGAKDGFPIVWLHGTPGAYTPLPSFALACEKKGLKLVTFSRPGYGDSTRSKGGVVVDIVPDVQALNKHLGIDRCFVGGWSGGGPSSLACAARLPGSVAAVCIAGVAPWDAEGLDFLAGQGQDNVEEFEAALRGEAEVTKYCEAMRVDMLKGGVADLIEAMDSLLPDVDKEVMTNGTMGQFMVDMVQDGLKNNAQGWIDDDLSCIKPWGFDFDEIKVPVILYQGSEDKMVPFSHGQWIAKHLPKEHLREHLMEGQGHLSIFIGQEDAIINELLGIKDT